MRGDGLPNDAAGRIVDHRDATGRDAADVSHDHLIGRGIGWDAENADLYRELTSVFVCIAQRHVIYCTPVWSSLQCLYVYCTEACDILYTGV